jgi:tellurite resistance protein TerC
VTLIWTSFVAFVLLVLFFDLFVLNRKQHVVSAREALRWTAVFITMGAMFSGVVYYLYEHHKPTQDQFIASIERREHAKDSAATPPDHTHDAGRPGGVRVSALEEARKSPGKTAMTQYLTGWLTEYSLSIDNIFVIALVFSHFRVQPQHQHRVLFWGIMGALFLRGIMIWAGVALVRQFEWVLVVFGLLLLFTAIKMVMAKESNDEFDEEHNFLVRMTRKIIPISPKFDEQKFFTKIDGKRMATPLFLVLLVVEGTDVIFAVDSIPAILGITQDPFLVFSSNVFAIMGLRSLYFALASLRDKFAHLKFSLGAILFYVGGKMIYEYFSGAHVSSAISLSVIAVSLAVGVGTSIVASRKNGDTPSGK